MFDIFIAVGLKTVQCNFFSYFLTLHLHQTQFVHQIYTPSTQVPLRQYYYVNKTMSWSEAQQYCREKYTDLATFDSMDDLKRLKANFSYSWAWIGLHDDPAAWRTSMGNESNSWRWSATGQTSRTGFQSWNSYSPDYWKGTETCATMDGRGQWNDNVFTDQNKKSYIFINQSMSWSSAQQYCRDNHKDLAMIENQEENMEALNAKPSSSKPWIGLYREPWTWSDGSLSSFRNWYPSGSDNYGGNQHCVTENTDHEWGDERCSIERVFVCHQGDHQRKKTFKNYVLINQAMSWSSAQQYCRTNYKDLAMIENQDEHTEALNAKSSTYKVWIGLYREPWTWSDGSTSSFRNWYPSGSDNYGGNQHCAAEDSDHAWSDEICSGKKVFICHQGDP
uniref:C-type lectin domain-containing protein n=1 Tax=Oryzias melastigma TaxID=30732 RepID=A0A3B3E0U2_ORYME